MAGVSTTTAQQQDVSLERAPVLPSGRVLAPHVPSLPWRLRRMSAVDNVRTSPLMLELPVSPVLQAALMPLANSSVEQLVGIVEDLFWRSGGSVPHQTSVQLP